MLSQCNMHATPQGAVRTSQPSQPASLVGWPYRDPDAPAAAHSTQDRGLKFALESRHAPTLGTDGVALLRSFLVRERSAAVLRGHDPLQCLLAMVLQALNGVGERVATTIQQHDSHTCVPFATPALIERLDPRLDFEDLDSGLGQLKADVGAASGMVGPIMFRRVVVVAAGWHARAVVEDHWMRVRLPSLPLFRRCAHLPHGQLHDHEVHRSLLGNCCRPCLCASLLNRPLVVLQ
mmetsp:Transcript_141943/g.453791  ORF Transcript_141943/g.453791 Transcript_141943/m.453791 type:complete len:235 (+) Transcript_141943:42-746(+)